MQTKESVQIDHRLARDVDVRAHRVILRLAVGNHNVQSVSRAALKNDDQPLCAQTRLSRAHGRTSEKARHRRRTGDRERAVANKNPASNGHETSL